MDDWSVPTGVYELGFVAAIALVLYYVWEYASTQSAANAVTTSQNSEASTAQAVIQGELNTMAIYDPSSVQLTAPNQVAGNNAAMYNDTPTSFLNYNVSTPIYTLTPVLSGSTSSSKGN